MHPKLNDHAQSDERTRDIRYQPTGILHHLEDGRRIVVIKARLVESQALVAQRVIHVDQRFPIFMAGRVQPADLGGEVFWDINPPRTIVNKTHKFNAKKLLEEFGCRSAVLVFSSPLLKSPSWE